MEFFPFAFCAEVVDFGGIIGIPRFPSYPKRGVLLILDDIFHYFFVKINKKRCNHFLRTKFNEFCDSSLSKMGLETLVFSVVRNIFGKSPLFCDYTEMFTLRETKQNWESGCARALVPVVAQSWDHCAANGAGKRAQKLSALFRWLFRRSFSSSKLEFLILISCNLIIKE